MKIDKENIILLHPGKTGGTSIEHTFRVDYLNISHLNSRDGNRDIMFGLDPEYRIYLQHADIRFYNLLNIPLYNYKVYTTVRRPYERILSCYYYNGKSTKYSFDEFVENHLEGNLNNNLEKPYAVSHFAPQWLFAKWEDYMVNAVIHQENLNEEALKLGIKVKFHHSKTTALLDNVDRMSAYTQKTKDIVYNLYKEDFKLFGYSK
jgi:hypothetical protein